MEILEQQLSPYSWMGFTKAAVDKPTSMLNIGEGDFQFAISISFSIVL